MGTGRSWSSSCEELVNLLSDDGLGWANINAGATVSAFFSVDCVDGVALSDGAYWALVDAGSTGNAFFSNFMSHDFLPKSSSSAGIKTPANLKK
jgi:hypothetical protein